MGLKKCNREVIEILFFVKGLEKFFHFTTVNLLMRWQVVPTLIRLLLMSSLISISTLHSGTYWDYVYVI